MSLNSHCNKQEGLPCKDRILTSTDTTLRVSECASCLSDFLLSFRIVGFLELEEVGSLLSELGARTSQSHKAL
jgi:hypothetical protein